MPLEGHYERQTTPLRRLSGRERGILVSFVVVLVLTCAVIAVYAGGHGKQAEKPGCLTLVFGSSMGAGYQHLCGADARRLCSGPASHRQDVQSQAARKACVAAGIG